MHFAARIGGITMEPHWSIMAGIVVALLGVALESRFPRSSFGKRLVALLVDAIVIIIALHGITLHAAGRQTANGVTVWTTVSSCFAIYASTAAIAILVPMWMPKTPPFARYPLTGLPLLASITSLAVPVIAMLLIFGHVQSSDECRRIEYLRYAFFMGTSVLFWAISVLRNFDDQIDHHGLIDAM